MLLLLLTLFYCRKLRHRAINLLAWGYGRCVAEAWNWPKSTKSLLGACSRDFPLFAFGCTATPEARQDVCNWSSFKRIFGISKILDCASVIFIYPCMSRGLSEIAILLFIFITLTIDFFFWIIRGSQQSGFLIFFARLDLALCSSLISVYLTVFSRLMYWALCWKNWV